MGRRRVLITGSSGLIGSEAVMHYSSMGDEVHGVDNNMRATFFGSSGDTTWNLRRLMEQAVGFSHHDVDIRDRQALEELVAAVRPDLVVHCAAQPSHDRAAAIPYLDFEVNALGTLNLLEATRQKSAEAVFVFMSTNKVYGDAPNELALVEQSTRWDYEDDRYAEGIDESMRIDQSKHSLFGASKVAADVMTQEYGRYFGLRTGVFRGGCLTGPHHSGVQLHGFLSYLIKVAVADEEYTVFGYKGKQVRDQIHSADVIAAFEAFYQSPVPGAVYNLGGGRNNSASILECLQMLEDRLARPVRWHYEDTARSGDHICYISDLARMRTELPGWDITRTLPSIVDEMLEAEQARQFASTA
jgi:CDP-paratose 2-epimerase